MNAPLARLAGAARQSAEERIAGLLDVTDALIRRTRSAEISLHEVAAELGISRALVYAYFPDRYRLLDAVLARHLAWLEQAGLSAAATAPGPFEPRVGACAQILLQHVVAHGATLELIMRERDVARQLDGTARRYLRRIVIALARQAVGELKMGNMEAVALVELLAVIPLEAARRVSGDGVDPEIAASVCARLVRSSVQAQVPAGAA